MTFKMNAELLSRTDPKSIRITLTSWLRWHDVSYDENMSIEELRQLYIDKETGRC